MTLANVRTALFSALVAVLLAGCSTTGDKGGGGWLLSDRPSSSTPYITALQGGIISRSDVEISNSDKARALEAEYRALEAAPGGQSVGWQGSDISGQVIAAAPYQVGSQNCRQYAHTITTGGREVKVRGAACRNKDGTWTPLI